MVHRRLADVGPGLALPLTTCGHGRLQGSCPQVPGEPGQVLRGGPGDMGGVSLGCEPRYPTLHPALPPAPRGRLGPGTMMVNGR